MLAFVGCNSFSIWKNREQPTSYHRYSNLQCEEEEEEAGHHLSGSILSHLKAITVERASNFNYTKSLIKRKIHITLSGIQHAP